jgi:hypothetical protein
MLCHLLHSLLCKHIDLAVGETAIYGFPPTAE